MPSSRPVAISFEYAKYQVRTIRTVVRLFIIIVGAQLVNALFKNSEKREKKRNRFRNKLRIALPSPRLKTYQHLNTFTRSQVDQIHSDDLQMTTMTKGQSVSLLATFYIRNSTSDAIGKV